MADDKKTAPAGEPGKGKGKGKPVDSPKTEAEHKPEAPKPDTTGPEHAAPAHAGEVTLDSTADTVAVATKPAPAPAKTAKQGQSDAAVAAEVAGAVVAVGLAITAAEKSGDHAKAAKLNSLHLHLTELRTHLGHIGDGLGAEIDALVVKVKAFL